MDLSTGRDNSIKGIAPYLALSCWVGVLLLLRGADQSLMAHDEGWYAQQARWIVENQDWITQQWWGQPIYDRAMGLQWLIAASYSIFGVNETAARLPAMVASLLSVWLLYSIGKRCVSEKEAFWGAAILAATPIWMQSSRLATQDIPLVCVELLGMWALLQAEDQPQRRRRWGLLAGCTFGIGFLIKGFMVVPASVALLPYLVLDYRRHRHLTNPGFYAGLGLGLVPLITWLWLSVDRYGVFVLKQQFGHLFYLSEVPFHPATPLYYFWNIPANAFPWPLLAVPGLWLGWVRPQYARKLLWMGFPVVLFGLLSLFSTRTWYYALQLLPFTALLASLTLNTLAQQYLQRAPQQRRLPAALSILLGGWGLLLIGAGGATLIEPRWFPLQPARLYGLAVLGLGLGWILPLWIYWLDRNRRPLMRNPWLWQLGWLLGPWLCIAVLFGTNLWGSYDEQIKHTLQRPPLAPVLEQQTVDFVFPNAYLYALTPEEIAANDYTLFLIDKESVLLTYYTPQLGQRLPSPAAIPPGGYAWMVEEDLPQLPPGFEILGGVRGWHLVHRPATSAQAAAGNVQDSDRVG